MVITGQHELRSQALCVEDRPLCELKGMSGQEARGRQALQSSRGGQDNHIHLTTTQPPKGRETFTDQILVGGERVIGEGLPVRQLRDPQRWRKPPDFFTETSNVGRAGCNDDKKAALRGRAATAFGEMQGIGRANGGRNAPGRTLLG